ncbi:hypothetical protein GCM10028815_25580 [Mariniluteicoccus flavus]
MGGEGDVVVLAVLDQPLGLGGPGLGTPTRRVFVADERIGVPGIELGVGDDRERETRRVPLRGGIAREVVVRVGRRHQAEGQDKAEQPRAEAGGEGHGFSKGGSGGLTSQK